MKQSNAYGTSLLVFLLTVGCSTPDHRAPAATEGRSVEEGQKPSEQVVADMWAKEGSRARRVWDYSNSLRSNMDSYRDGSAEVAALAATIQSTTGPLDVLDVAKALSNGGDPRTSNSRDFLDEDADAKWATADDAKEIFGDALGFIVTKISDPQSPEAKKIGDILVTGAKIAKGEVAGEEAYPVIDKFEKIVNVLKEGDAKNAEEALAVVESKTPVMPADIQKQFGQVIKNSRVDGFEGMDPTSDDYDPYFDKDKYTRVTKLNIKITGKSKWDFRRGGRVRRNVVNKIESPFILQLTTPDEYTIDEEIVLPSFLDLTKKKQELEISTSTGGRTSPGVHTHRNLLISPTQLTYISSTFNFGKGTGDLSAIRNGKQLPGLTYQVEMSYIKHEDRVEITALRITEKIRSRKTGKYATRTSVEALLLTPVYIAVKQKPTPQ